MDVSGRSILELADELLVHIFSFLSSEDLLSLANICERFHKVCCEKKLVRHLQFSKHYSITASGLRSFFHSSTRCHNVSSINLNYCYWLQSKDLYFLSKLKHLHELHILECHISLRRLQLLLKDLRLLSLSWTWDRLAKEEHMSNECAEVFKKSIGGLRKLRLQVSCPFQLSQIGFLLQCCPHLEHLEIAEQDSWGRNVTSAHMRGEMLHYTLPNLLNCHILLHSENGYSVERFAFTILNSLTVNSSLKGFWTVEGGCNVLSELCEMNKLSKKSLKNAEVLSLNGLRRRNLIIRTDPHINSARFVKNVLQCQEGLSKCKRLSLDLLRIDSEILTVVSRSCPQIEYLSLQECQFQGSLTEILQGLTAVGELCECLTTINLSGTHLYSSDENPCAFLALIKGLKSLTLPLCMLGRSTQNNIQNAEMSSTWGLKKPQRCGLQTLVPEETQQYSRLYPITVGCQKLRELVIIHEQVEYGCSDKVPDEDFYCIAKWKELRVLTLNNIPGIRHATFLISISKNCKNLQFLSLAHLGSRGSFVYLKALLEMLPLCHSLKDFRLEQNYIKLNSELGAALSQCLSLQRLCIYCEFGDSRLDPRVIISLVEKLPNLIALFLVTNCPNSTSFQLQHSLIKMFEPSRPAFTCMIVNRRNLPSVVPHLPSFHVEEMFMHYRSRRSNFHGQAS